MKKLIALAFLVLGLNSFGQYSTAIGLRAGETSGLTVKQFVGSSTAIEGIVGFWHSGMSVNILFEKYQPAFGDGFNWYYGGGGHVAFFTDYGRRNYYDDRYRGRRFYYYNDGFGLGIDGIVGLEYKIPKAPIAFSIDLKPYVEFGTNGGVWGSIDPGLGVKFAF